MTLQIWLNPNDDTRRSESVGRVTALENSAEIDANDVAENTGSGPPSGAVINLKDALDFNDAADYLETAGNYTFSGPDLTVIAAYTDDGVAAAGADQAICGASDGSTIGWSLKKEISTTPIRFDIQASGGLEVAGGATVENADVIVGRYDSVRDYAELIKNFGAAQASADKAVTLNVTQQFEIGNDGSGARGWGSGYVADVIVFDGVLRYDQIQRVESYLAFKYDIPLPAGHPYANYPADLEIDSDFIATFEGADAATSYTAETGQTATFVGNAQLDIASSKYGATSLLLDGTGDYVTFPDGAEWELGANDFTIECWFNTDVATSDELVLSHHGNLTAYGWYVQLLASSLRFAWSTNGSNIQTSDHSFTFSTGQWYHICFVRKNNLLYAFVDGVLLGTNSAISGVTIFDPGQVFAVGARSIGSFEFNGWIDGVRIVKGKGLYTESFTPPHRPFRLPVQSELICNFNGPDAATAYTSEDAGARTATFVGNAQLDTAQKKFGHSSLLLDGTGDYVTFPDSADFELGGGDFTIEAWVRWSADPTTTTEAIVGKFTETGDQREWQLDYDNDTIRFGWSTNGTAGTFASIASSTFSPTAGVWYHVAVERHNDILTIWVDGVVIANAAITATFFAGTSPLMVGGNDAAAGETFTGHIDACRVIKGLAVRSGIRPPEGPMTAWDKAELMLNFDGVDAAQAYTSDDAVGRTLTFAGTAQLDTAIRNRGISSLLTDGNGDYVDIASEAALQIGTNDFTIEVFAKFDTIVGSDIFFDQRTSGTTEVAPALYLSGGQLRYYTAGADRITGTTLSTNTWYHIVLQRINNVTRLYLDGVQDGADYADSNNYIQQRIRIGENTGPLNNGIDGNISLVRFEPSKALYGGDFDVPVAGMGEPII